MLAAFPLPLAGEGEQTEFATRADSAPHERGLSGALLDQRLAGWLGLRGHTSARCRIAPAGTVGRDGRVPQSRVVVAVDHPLDLGAVDADVLERAVIERTKLAHRRVALAAQRVGLPPSACRGGDPPSRDAYRAQDDARKVAQRLGAGGFRGADDAGSCLVPLPRGQAVVIKIIFVVDKHADLLRSRSLMGVYARPTIT